MCRDVSDGDAEVVLLGDLGDPLLDVKLLGRAGVSKTARAFRHCSRYDTAASLCAFMFQVFNFVSLRCWHNPHIIMQFTA